MNLLLSSLGAMPRFINFHFVGKECRAGDWSPSAEAQGTLGDLVNRTVSRMARVRNVYNKSHGGQEDGSSCVRRLRPLWGLALWPLGQTILSACHVAFSLTGSLKDLATSRVIRFCLKVEDFRSTFYPDGMAHRHSSVFPFDPHLWVHSIFAFLVVLLLIKF